jgi:hypothetical protein
MVDLNIEWEIMSTYGSHVEVSYKCNSFETRLNIPVINHDIESSVRLYSPNKHFLDLIDPNKPDYSKSIGSKGQYTESIDPNNISPVTVSKIQKATP